MIRKKVYHSISEIDAEEWNGNLKLPFFSKHNSLHTIEKSKINNINPIYYSFQNGKDVGRANLYTVKTDLSTFDNKLKTIRKTIKSWYPDFLDFTTLECGFFSAIGEGLSLSDESHYPEVLHILANEMDVLSKKQNAQMQFIRDVPLKKYRLYKSVLKDYGFYPTPGFPNTEINLGCTSLEEYLSRFKSDKKINLRRQLRKVINREDITYEFVADYGKYAPLMAEFWKNVSQSSDAYQREVLDENYFRIMAENHRGESEVLFFKQNGIIISFILCLMSEDCYFLENYGVDYDNVNHQELNTYKAGILLCLERAIALKKPKASLGITTYYPKLLIGAEVKPLVYFVKYTGNPHYSKALAKMFYDDIQQPDLSIHKSLKDRGKNKINLQKLGICIRNDQNNLEDDDIFLKVDKYQRMDSMRLANIYNLYPEFKSAQKSSIQIRDMEKVVLLGTNSYLGAANMPAVKAAAIAAVEKYGSGCSGSPLLNGTLDIHNQLEKKLSGFLNREAVMLCSTGYQTNLAGLTALAGPGDVLVMDERSHRSLFDGAKLCGANYYIYKHNNMEHLEWVLAKLKNKRKMIISDSVFSMEGVIADLEKICDLAEKYHARTFIDESHAVGVFGRSGRGVCEHLGVEERVDILMGTFSKSFAAIGGFLAGKTEIIDFIKHTGSPHIFSASLPPSAIATVLAVLDIIKEQPDLRKSVLEKAEYMANALYKLGYNAEFKGTQIVPVIFGNEVLAMAAYKRFMEDGVYVNPILPPAVPESDSGFRTSYIATHKWEDLDKAIYVFEKNKHNFTI